MNRRTILKAGFVLAATSHTAVATAEVQPAKITIDDFLAKAAPSERARYHANALAEVMGEMHPDRSWRSHVDHQHSFCLIVGDEVTL